MTDVNAKRNAELAERRDHVCTTGGPTQEAEDLDSLNQKFKNQKLLVKLNLEKQMQMEANEKNVKKEIQLDEERNEADRVAAKHLESKMNM